MKLIRIVTTHKFEYDSLQLKKAFHFRKIDNQMSCIKTKSTKFKFEKAIQILLAAHMVFQNVTQNISKLA